MNVEIYNVCIVFVRDTNINDNENDKVIVKNIE
jgi:hypothetical protein